MPRKLNLKILRKSKDMKQSDLAKIAGVSLRQIQYYEQGISEPNAETLKRIAKHFNVSTDYLLGSEQEEIYEDEEIIIGLVAGLSPEQKKVVVETVKAQVAALKKLNNHS